MVTGTKGTHVTDIDPMKRLDERQGAESKDKTQSQAMDKLGLEDIVRLANKVGWNTPKRVSRWIALNS